MLFGHMHIKTLTETSLTVCFTEGILYNITLHTNIPPSSSLHSEASNTHFLFPFPYSSTVTVSVPSVVSQFLAPVDAVPAFFGVPKAPVDVSWPGVLVVAVNKVNTLAELLTVLIGKEKATPMSSHLYMVM